MIDTPVTGPALAGASRAPGAQPDDRVLLVPATDADKDATAESTDRYDDERRPAYTLKVMKYRQPDPEFW